MELTLEHPYEVGLDHIIERFFSEHHIIEKNEKLGSRNLRVAELQRDDAAAKLVIEREMMASAPVPGMLASFHREWNRVRQEEHWFKKDDGEWHCEFRVRIDGVPARIKGIMRLLGNGNRCINYVNLSVHCDVPFLGKKVAKFLAEDSHAKIEREYEVTRQLL
ncbi:MULTISPECIES: DUF2505 domain-containing protein [Marinobacter]|jgi:hypothetical protein|uniref:DUF2505 domain-containing protein n=2 Tax=Marinobacter TaxID=2742 RepID=A0A455W7Y9_MARNT|nr:MULTISPECIES: DUF2505 domain-containing protein [Marinobacter]WBU40455.1 DUF2505 domain-containing protein [Marinobacter alkaliphilus]BBJ05241.1 hypothetical protein YBY_30900 [Marinobacter nauticus]MAO14110.1 hypothetical protein [Marinobacter sp.]PSF12570.1 DUF2505 domain-containing protein [Marinobacter shengliensis]QFS88155.1 hypothetical protein FIV08_15070 [Marinobacter sp. THAF197a]